MNRIFKIAMLLLVFSPVSAYAQKEKKDGEIFCSNDYAGGNLIRVKWLYKAVYHPDGFDVYRQEKGGSNWTKINSSPVLPIKTLPAGNKMDQESKDFHKALVNMSHQELADNPVRAFIIIKGIYSDELAESIGMMIKDNSVSSGKEYIYKFCIAGTTDAISTSQPIVAGSYTKTGAPENIKIKRSKKRVDISWKPEIYRYYGVYVYRKKVDETEFVKISNLPRAIQKEHADKYSEKSIYYQDTNIVYDANYVYKFIGIDYFGQETEASAEFTVAAEDFIPPTAPFNVTPTASSVNQYVRLDWKLIEESDLAGVNIYESSLPENGFTKLNTEIIPKSQLTYTHMNASVGGHYYKVTAVDLAGNENNDGMVFVDIKDITPPSIPKGLVAESGEGYITLKWNANTEKDLAGYMVQRTIKKQSDDGKSYVNVNTDPIKETTFTEKLPKNVRNEFVYRIIAIDTNFNRSKPSENTLAKMPDVTPPMVPLIKNVTCDSSQAVITWLLNADSDLAGYNVYRRVFKDSLAIEKINFSLVPAKVNSYTDRSISQGMSYEYMIEAVDQFENKSEKSKPYFAKTPEKKVSGTIELVSKKVNAKKGTVHLEWESHIVGEIKGYVVYKRIDEKSTFKPTTGLITDNEANIPIDGLEVAELHIRCYTMDGQTVQTSNFKINENNDFKK